MRPRKDTSQNPYLSLVVPSRNDDHGGNMLRRTQVSLSGLLEQLEKYKIESELILVEWNPPADRPLLKDVIKWPGGLKYCTIRVIVVPPAIHQRYEGSDKRAFHGAVSQNVGIRRARGQFILLRPIDLIYSDDLMAYVAQKELKKDCLYRTNRCDVDRRVVQYNSLEQQLDFCQQNILKINSNEHENARHGLPDLHTYACGDFQLMARDYWHLLRGYREADIIAAHVDGLLSYASYAAGVKEVILNDPMRIYHIDHDSKFTDRIKAREPRFEELLSHPLIPKSISNRMVYLYRKFMGRKIIETVYGMLGYADFLEMCRDVLADKRSYIFNDKRWGLGEEKLPETLISVAAWEQ